MKLPENYQNWIEVAKECLKVQAKHPDAKEITFDYHGIVSEKYNINTVKAKAFDEVMEMVDFHRNDVMYLRDSSLSHGCRFEKIDNITDLLVKLCQK